MSTTKTAIKQLSDQVRTISVSKLINGISGDLQKLLKYFNGTIISTSFLVTLSVLPVIFSLNLYKLVIALALVNSAITSAAGSSLQYLHKRLDVFE